MGSRSIAFIGIMLFASHVWAQATPRTPRTPQTPQTPQTPAAVPAPPPPPAVPAPPPPPPAPPGQPVQRGGQPINVKVELTISEDGGQTAPLKKTVTVVAGDGFNGYVREMATSAQPTGPFERIVAPLNLDAMPAILANGKIRVSCTIQYVTRAPGQDERRMTTDIKQNLVFILESGKALVVSQATDPVSDRRVTVEVTATILK